MRIPIEFLWNSYGIPMEFLWKTCLSEVSPGSQGVTNLDSYPVEFMEFLWNSYFSYGIPIEFSYRSYGIPILPMEFLSP